MESGLGADAGGLQQENLAYLGYWGPVLSIGMAPDSPVTAPESPGGDPGIAVESWVKFGGGISNVRHELLAKTVTEHPATTKSVFANTVTSKDRILLKIVSTE